MRKTKWTVVLVAAVCAVLALGCAGDAGKQVMASPELQAKVMDMISADPATAGGMVDRLLGSDSARAVVIEKLVGTAGGAQAVMEVVGSNQTLIDGALNIAMQDPDMKEHVMTLFKGMKMAGAK
jgi:hypothetical protein